MVNCVRFQIGLSNRDERKRNSRSQHSNRRQPQRLVVDNHCSLIVFLIEENIALSGELGGEFQCEFAIPGAMLLHQESEKIGS